MNLSLRKHPKSSIVILAIMEVLSCNGTEGHAHYGDGKIMVEHVTGETVDEIQNLIVEEVLTENEYENQLEEIEKNELVAIDFINAIINKSINSKDYPEHLKKALTHSTVSQIFIHAILHKKLDAIRYQGELKLALKHIQNNSIIVKYFRLMIIQRIILAKDFSQFLKYIFRTKPTNITAN